VTPLAAIVTAARSGAVSAIFPGNMVREKVAQRVPSQHAH